MIRIAVLSCLLAAAASAGWREEGVIELGLTPGARLKPLPVRAVSFRDGFWKQRLQATVETSLPTLYALMEENGWFDNFRRLKGKQTPRRGPLFTDSDVYKWMEAAAWALHTGAHPILEKQLNELIDLVLSVQEPSGYLNTWHVGERVSERFQKQETNHELYCLGHWIQAGVAIYRYNGDRRFLDGGLRFANYLIEIGGPGKQPLLTGHPELELALAEAWRITRDRRYLDLAGYLFSGVEKDRLKLTPRSIAYMFSGSPFAARRKFEGHAVRALYAATGAADYWMETGNEAYAQALQALWTDLTSAKMFVTGGVGSRAAGETFGDAYELPNQQAYTESCAAIANWLFAQRMLAATGSASYAAVMERALYNGINSGMSLSGALYCYRNPLASTGGKIRNPWYNTLCCPPNLQRTFMSLGGYFYSVSAENGDNLWLHFYDNHRFDWRLPSGLRLQAEMNTGLPWAGHVRYVVQPEKPAEFTLRLRVPEWSAHTQVSVNGAALAAKVQPNTYVEIKRLWKPGDTVTLAFDMSVKQVFSNPRVPENHGKTAFQRGPFLYCLEQADLVGYSVFDVSVNPASFQPVRRLDLFKTPVVLLAGSGFGYDRPASEAPLYTYGRPPRPSKPVSLLLIPYFAFNNRGDHPYTLWLPVAEPLPARSTAKK